MVAGLCQAEPFQQHQQHSAKGLGDYAALIVKALFHGCPIWRSTMPAIAHDTHRVRRSGQMPRAIVGGDSRRTGT